MKKITVMAFLLALLAPVAQVWAGGDSTTYYYAALTAQVSSSGGGMVYASDSSNTPSDSSFNANQSTKQSSGSFSKFCFCAHAKANEGYRFTGWTGGVTSSDISCKVLVTSTSTSSSTYTTKTVTANFEQLPPATVTFAAPANGSYTVNGEAVNAQLVKANQPVPYSVTLVATPASNFRFAGWYVLENGNKSFFSTDASTTKKFDVDVTVGAEFIPDGYAIYAARAAKGYDNLATALAEAEPGESISVFSSAMLNSSTAVPFGVSLTVASGATLTVASGEKLYVDGSASINGTISGTVSKCTKLIQQKGQSDGVPFNPYGDVKYWKTSISIPSISVSSSQTHATIINGLGKPFRYSLSSSAKLIKCTIDSSVAVNHIKSISGESTSVNVVNDTLNPGMVILLGGDCVINGGLTDKAGFRGVVDCANNPCTTVSGVEVSGNNGLATFLNCPSFTMNKVINITHDYYNCDIVLASKGSFNAGNSATLKFYDCGTFANPAPDPFNGKDAFSSGPSTKTKFHFYSGYYDSISYLTNFKIYGGSYKSDPKGYIADTDNFESVYDSVSKYYNVQEKVDIVNVVAIDGKEYASLSEAVSAASNGATISLIEAVDLTGTTVTIPAGKTLIIATDKHSINGGKIVNNGTLLIVDATIENEGKIKCDIENNGTLDLVFGTYSGAIVNKAGTLTTHNGVFTGTLTKNGGTVNINGGHFAADPSELVSTDGYIIAKDGAGRFCVCEVPNGAMYADNVSGITGYGVTPYTYADFNVMYSRVKESKTKRSDYSDANWRRLAELLCFYEIYYNKQLDATLIFDRDVAAKSVNLYAKSTVVKPVDLVFDLPAGEPFRALTASVTASGTYVAKQYKALWEENIMSVAMAVSDKDGNNNGTVCTAMIELWDTERAEDYHAPDNIHMLTNTIFVAAQKRFTIGAGDNVAMIRPATGAAKFYATVSAALAAVEDGGTVMLANDSADDVVFAKVGTYTIDANGFAFSGSVTAAEGFTVASQGEGVYVVTSNPGAKIDVETVVSQVVSEEWLEANDISTEGKTDKEVQAAVQDVLNEKDDNGNAKWENLVIGQKADEKAAVTAANGGDDKTANIEVTFEVPKDKTTGDKIDTGYTVKYAFDKVDETVEGGVVKGEAKEEPTLDFEEVAVNEPTYFKMRAVLEASDDSGVTAEVPVEKTIGVVKVASNAEVTIIPVPWQSLGDGDIKASELVHAASLSDDDELIVYGTDGKPQTWIVKNGEWTAPVAEYTIGGDVSEPQQEEQQEAAELTRGQGAILKRTDTTKEIVLIGQAVSDEDEVKTDLAPAKEVGEPTWNIVASPKMAEVAVGTVAGENTSDEIIVPTAGTPKHYTYKNGNWGYPGAEVVKEITRGGKTIKIVTSTHYTEDNKVPAGTGFWYLNNSTDDSKKISW